MASFNHELGLEPIVGGVRLETRPEHQVAPGLIHFAVLTTIAEVSAASTVEASVVPVDVHVRLMRAAKPGELIGRGTLLKQGRKLAFTEGTVEQDGRVVAKASVTFAVLGGTSDG